MKAIVLQAIETPGLKTFADALCDSVAGFFLGPVATLEIHKSAGPLCEEKFPGIWAGKEVAADIDLVAEAAQQSTGRVAIIFETPGVAVSEMVRSTSAEVYRVSCVREGKEVLEECLRQDPSLTTLEFVLDVLRLQLGKENFDESSEERLSIRWESIVSNVLGAIDRIAKFAELPVVHNPQVDFSLTEEQVGLGVGQRFVLDAFCGAAQESNGYPREKFALDETALYWLELVEAMHARGRQNDIPELADKHLSRERSIEPLLEVDESVYRFNRRLVPSHWLSDGMLFSPLEVNRVWRVLRKLLAVVAVMVIATLVIVLLG